MTENHASIEFLKLVLPDGPWALTAITTDRKSIKTETFSPAQENEAIAFTNKYNGERNIYWHVNPPMQMITKKAAREDIRAVVQFHVDIDPRAGEDIEKEKARALKMLENPPEGIPKPTTVLDSGGGIQAFWKLIEPIGINGDLELAEDAKLYNMKLEQVFGADNCHNIDRLCRLPGTINVPDTKKIAKGRTKQLSTLIWHNKEGLYKVDEFKKAVLVQSAKLDGFIPTKNIALVSSNLPRLARVDELDQDNVPARINVIIVQGHDPINPKPHDNSRSAWLFDCLCQLLRANVPDRIIYSIITDPNFVISASVIAKGRNAEKYALRQIERAKEHAVNPMLCELNDRYAVILNIGGKCRVIEEAYDSALKRTRLTRQTFDDFKNAHLNYKVQVGNTKDDIPVYKPLGKWWLEHPQRRQYGTLTFAPGCEVENAYNLWQGFSFEPIEGDCSLFLEHIKENVCCGNKEYYNYLLSWMAKCVQQPDSPGYAAIVLRGGRGTGKSFFAKEFGSLFGRHMLHVSDSKHLVGSFNAHLRDCIVLFGDEAFYAGDKKHESILKMLITEETIAIEAKGIDMEASPNFTHIILASNDEWVIPAGADERRFFVLDVSEGRKGCHDYFSKIKAQMDNGGRAALLYHLMHHDLSTFEVRDVPKTKALQEQKEFSMSAVDEWISLLLQNGILPKMINENISLSEDLLDHARIAVPKLRNISFRMLAKPLKNLGCIHYSSGSKRGWVFPPLKEMRQLFDKKYGLQEWDDPIQTKWGHPTATEGPPPF